MVTYYGKEMPRVHVTWRIKRNPDVYEDFRRAKVYAFLRHGNVSIYIPIEVLDGVISFELPLKMPDGIYDLKAIWTKDDNCLVHDRPIARRYVMSEVQDIFAVSSYKDCCDPIGEEPVEMTFTSTVASYGYDGLDAYEKAVMTGRTTLSEEEWLNFNKDMQELKEEIGKIPPVLAEVNKMKAEVAHLDVWIGTVEGKHDMLQNAAFCHAVPESGNNEFNLVFRSKTGAQVDKVSIPFASQVPGSGESSYGMMPKNCLAEHNAMWGWYKNVGEGIKSEFEDLDEWIGTVEGKHDVLQDVAFCNVCPESGNNSFRLVFNNKAGVEKRVAEIPFAKLGADGTTSSYGLMPLDTLYEHQVMWNWMEVASKSAMRYVDILELEPGAVIEDCHKCHFGTKGAYTHQTEVIWPNGERYIYVCAYHIYIEEEEYATGYGYATFEVRSDESEKCKFIGITSHDETPEVIRNLFSEEAIKNLRDKITEVSDSSARVLDISTYCRRGADTLPELGGKVLKNGNLPLMHYRHFEHNADGPIWSIDAFCWKHMTEEYQGKIYSIDIFLNGGYLFSIRMAEHKMQYMCYVNEEGSVVRIDESYVEGLFTYQRLLSVANRAIGELGEGLYLKVKDLGEKTNILGVAVGNKASDHSYSFEHVVTYGKGCEFIISYNHGDVPRSLQPRIVCYTKGDGQTVWNQPFQWSYIDTSGAGNPTEYIPYRYGDRTPALSGSGKIHIYMAFDDEPDTYLNNEMECYINLEWNEALWAHDDERRTAPVSGRLVVNRQDIVMKGTGITSYGETLEDMIAGMQGPLFQFWARPETRISSIAFSSGEDYRPIGQLFDPTKGTWTNTISGMVVPKMSEHQYSLVSIEWKIPNAAKNTDGSIDVSLFGMTKMPFHIRICDNPILERITMLQEEIEKLKIKNQ